MNQATIINPPSSSDLPNDFVSSIGETESQPRPRTWASIRESVSNAKVRCGELYDGARDKVVTSARATDEAVRMHPYAAMAIAASAGVLAGVLIGRRRSKDITGE